MRHRAGSFAVAAVCGGPEFPVAVEQQRMGCQPTASESTRHSGSGVDDEDLVVVGPAVDEDPPPPDLHHLFGGAVSVMSMRERMRLVRGCQRR